MTPLKIAAFIALLGFAAALDAAPDRSAPPPATVAEPGAKADTAAQRYLVYFDGAPVARYAGTQAKRADAPAATSPAVTGLKLADNAAAVSAYRAVLARQRGDALDAAARTIGRPLRPTFVYELAANAAALTLTPDEAQRLRALPGIARVVPDGVRRPLTDAGPRWIGAEAVWNAPAPLGTRGEGVVVGVIDTGINATHPSFAAVGPVDGHAHANPRGGFYGRCAGGGGGCSAKLIGIWDFTTDGPDDEPNTGSDLDGHGSHVSSTAAGNVLDVELAVPGGAFPRRIAGVAPHANLISYKACEVEADCLYSWLLAAIDQAIADGVDVINYSIGGVPTDPWSSPDAEALLSARAAGIVPVVAAGNNGSLPGSVSSPGDAPWVLSVANATHDRTIANRLVDLAGGDTPAPGDGVLVGAGFTAGYGPAPMVIPHDHPGCSIGSDIDSPPTGASNPWPGQPNRFDGEIVVCERGTQARVAKSFNVGLAGGGGMVLVNTALEGESIVADEHSIPATHLGYADGRALRDWLATGSGHTGRLEGTTVVESDALGDVLAASSGRGPMRWGGYASPWVTAPGTSILAAAGSGNGTALLSGTSMASPHVAGAAALLIAAHPEWNVSDVISALVGSARPSVRDDDGSTMARVSGQGAGMVQVQRATRAGLTLRTDVGAFADADPSAGGDPQALNLPALVVADCFERCSLSRTVTDLAGGGDWQVSFEGPDGAVVDVEPSTFSLAADASRTLAFDIDVSDPRLSGGWVEGRVRIGRVTDDDVESLVLPLAVYADAGDVPENIPVVATTQAGYVDVELDGLVALPDARFAVTPLTESTRVSAALVADDSANQPFDDLDEGVLFRMVDIPPSDAPQVLVATTRAQAGDMDLYLGLDNDGDGAPDAAEQGCDSRGPAGDEQCVLTLDAAPTPRAAWVLVHHFRAGLPSTENVELDYAVLTAGERAGAEQRFAVTGPGRVEAGEPIALRLSWNDPTLLPDERRMALLEIGATAYRIGDTARIPILFATAAPTSTQPLALVPGRAQPVRLPPGDDAQASRWFVEVPPSATSLVADSSGSGDIELILWRAGPTAGPDIEPAPAVGEVVASSEGGADHLLTVEGDDLVPGRWYLQAINRGSGAADIGVRVTLLFDARPQPAFGAWYNPQRSGAGVFLYESGQTWALFWYTFDDEGQPTWYLGSGVRPTVQSGVWRVDLVRYAWNGAAAHGTVVGEALLSLESTDRFRFTWTVDGRTGSEPYELLDAGGCIDGMDLTGSWYAPSQPGYGYSIGVQPAVEYNAAYFYDDDGRARWAFGSNAPSGPDAVTLMQYEGACPWCTYVAPETTPIGSFVRRYDGETAGEASFDVTLQPPLSGTWNTSAPITKLAGANGCE